MAKFLEFLYKISKYFIKEDFKSLLRNGQIHACEEAVPYTRTHAFKGIFQNYGC